jgi:hypothetical protein
MNEPKQGWREIYEKNKVVILICAAVGIALSFAGGSGDDTPVVIVGGDVSSSGNPTSETGTGPTIDEWRKDQDRKDKRHDEFVDSVIREEQTCSNGKVVSIHDTCPDE